MRQTIIVGGESDLFALARFGLVGLGSSINLDAEMSRDRSFVGYTPRFLRQLFTHAPKAGVVATLDRAQAAHWAARVFGVVVLRSPGTLAAIVRDLRSSVEAGDAQSWRQFDAVRARTALCIVLEVVPNNEDLSVLTDLENETRRRCNICDESSGSQGSLGASASHQCYRSESRVRGCYVIGPYHRLNVEGEQWAASVSWPVDAARLIGALHAHDLVGAHSGLIAWSAREFGDPLCNEHAVQVAAAEIRQAFEHQVESSSDLRWKAADRTVPEVPLEEPAVLLEQSSWDDACKTFGTAGLQESFKGSYDSERARLVEQLHGSIDGAYDHRLASTPWFAQTRKLGIRTRVGKEEAEVLASRDGGGVEAATWREIRESATKLRWVSDGDYVNQDDARLASTLRRQRSGLNGILAEVRALAAERRRIAEQSRELVIGRSRWLTIAAVVGCGFLVGLTVGAAMIAGSRLVTDPRNLGGVERAVWEKIAGELPSMGSASGGLPRLAPIVLLWAMLAGLLATAASWFFERHRGRLATRLVLEGIQVHRRRLANHIVSISRLVREGVGSRLVWMSVTKRIRVRDVARRMAAAIDREQESALQFINQQSSISETQRGAYRRSTTTAIGEHDETKLIIDCTEIRTDFVEKWSSLFDEHSTKGYVRTRVLRNATRRFVSEWLDRRVAQRVAAKGTIDSAHTAEASRSLARATGSGGGASLDFPGLSVITRPFSGRRRGRPIRIAFGGKTEAAVLQNASFDALMAPPPTGVGLAGVVVTLVPIRLAIKRISTDAKDSPSSSTKVPHHFEECESWDFETSENESNGPRGDGEA